MALDQYAFNVPKRTSTVENFLRKKLSPKELHGLSYYETCVAEWKKGSLVLGYVAVAKDSLIVMSGNPPKSIAVKLPLAKIANIALVADRESLVRGSQGGKEFVCRHVRIQYTESELDENDAEGSHGGSGSINSHDDSFSRSSSVSDMSIEGSDQLEAFRRLAPSFLRHLYGSFSEVAVPASSNYSNASLRISRSSNGSQRPPSSISGEESSSSSSDKHDFEVKSLCSSITLDDTTSDDMNENRRLALAGKGLLERPGEKVRAASVMDNKANGNWQNSDDRSKQPERPQSIDISQLSTLRNRLIPSYFTRHGGSRKINERPQRLYRDPKESPPTLDSDCFPVKEFHLYLYKQPSTFLNELYLSWNKSKLSACNEPDELGPSPCIDDEEAFVTKNLILLMEQEKLLMASKARQKFLATLPLVSSFRSSLLKHFELRRLCWNRPQLLTGLVQLAQACVTPRRMEAACESLDEFLASFVTFGVLMDIFRLLFESCTTSVLANNNNNIFAVKIQFCQTISQIVSAICSYPCFPIGYLHRQRAFHIITHPLKYSKLDWNTTEVAGVIKAVTTSHNAAIALLYEILSLLHFSPCENEKKRVFAQFNTVALENVLRLSVTQLITMLLPSTRPLKFPESNLLYRHIYVVHALTDHFQPLKCYAQVSFCEEFRYCIRQNCIEEKVSDLHPLKSKLQDLFQQLRQIITGSSPSTF